MKSTKHNNETPEQRKKLPDSELRRAAKQKPNVRDVRIISPSDVETAAWVRLKCQYGCDGYGSCLVCPPFTPTPRQMREVLDSYHRAVLVHFAPEAQIKATVVDLEREFFLRGAWKAFGIGAGACSLCEECNVERQQCRNPNDARPAMEACGIDVFSTVRKAGLPIEVVQTKSQCPDFYGLILID
jgi:predicted metal-binding protein